MSEAPNAENDAGVWFRENSAAQAALGCVREVLIEYERSCNPAPYTSERALYERISAAVGHDIPPGEPA